MTKPDDEPTAARAAAPAREPAGMEQGMRMLSYLISGVLAYGLLGWLGDHLLHTRFLLPTGIVVGAGLGIYLVIRRATADLTGAASGPTTTETTTTKGRV